MILPGQQQKSADKTAQLYQETHPGEAKSVLGAKDKNSGQPSIAGGYPGKVRARSSILGQIRSQFFNIKQRILKPRVPQPKTTHLFLQFCLIEKNWRVTQSLSTYFHQAFLNQQARRRGWRL
jgi:hypothetical protein